MTKKSILLFALAMAPVIAAQAADPSNTDKSPTDTGPTGHVAKTEVARSDLAKFDTTLRPFISRAPAPTRAAVPSAFTVNYE